MSLFRRHVVHDPREAAMIKAICVEVLNKCTNTHKRTQTHTFSVTPQ